MWPWLGITEENEEKKMAVCISVEVLTRGLTNMNDKFLFLTKYERFLFKNALSAGMARASISRERIVQDA